MLKSCQYCGKIHDSKFDCGKKPKKQKEITYVDRFRWTASWKNKREQIKKRDSYLCQACIRNLHGTIRIYNYDKLSVHHAISIEQDYGKRLDDDNLITLCDVHHEMAEDGRISYDAIKKMIEEQEAAGIQNT